MGPDAGIPSWALVALPLVIATTIISGILFAGPAVGFLAATIIAGLIVIAAIRAKPGERASTGATRSTEPGVRDTREHGWRAAAARRALVPLALAAAAVVVIAATGGTARVIGWGLLGVAVAVALSLTFLEVGYSEDRARARAERRRGSGRSGP